MYSLLSIMMLYKHSHQSYPPKSATMGPVSFDLYRQGYLAVQFLTSARTDTIFQIVILFGYIFVYDSPLNFLAFKQGIKKASLLNQILHAQAIRIMRTWGHRSNNHFFTFCFVRSETPYDEQLFYEFEYKPRPKIDMR